MQEDKKEKKTITLSDGRVAEVREFKGKHIIKAQQIAGGKQENLILALVSLCVTVDEKPVIMEDLEEMNGADVLLLMGEFSGNFTQGANK